MFGNFMLKQMMKSQMKHVPQEQQEQLLSMVEKNPELFKKIAEEVQVKIKDGKDQMAATTEVIKKYQAELKKLTQ